MKKIDDEKLLEMLIVQGSVKATADALGISRNAIYKRLKDEDFKNKYERMQGVILSVAASAMVENIQSAITVLKTIMENEEAADGVRLSAADSLLRHCVRYVEVSNILKRIESLEKSFEENDKNAN